MARIAGVTIPSEKQVQIALTYIYGIGPKHASSILAAAKIEPTTRVKNLTEAEEQKIREIIDNDYTTEGDLQRLVTNNIKRLKDVGLVSWPSSQIRFADTWTAYSYECTNS
jgi:small subunit ribosomal protein S13